MPDVGLHLDEGKTQVEGIDPRFIMAIGEILTHGATTKYARFNWVKGIAYSRVYASLQRHLQKWYMGKEMDEDSGKPHLWHAACDLMFLLSYTERPKKYEDLDDRPFKGGEDK